MKYLSISDDCSECGKCTVFLPGIVERIESKGPVPINMRNQSVDWPRINSAIATCPTGAMTLNDDMGCSS